jgi:ABC-type glycerol-3-phosphate transport system substrate-binding protein
MHTSRRRRVVAALGSVILGCGVLAACSSDDGSETSGSGDSGDTVAIRVQGMPPGTDQAGQEQFTAQIEEFEAANPGVTVEATTNEYDAMTFSAQLAGGSIEDVIRVPLTEPQGLIERGQVQPITQYLEAWEHYQEFNPQVLEPLSDAGGDVYGIPRSPFALGLAYNRALFEQAALDPDQPPTTWDEVRQYAKAISEETGKAGFVHESKDGQGGWQLAMLTYAHGGELERAEGDTYVADFQNDAVRDSLKLLHEMRWTDDSMGSTQLLNQDDVVRLFAAGEIGMFMGTPGTYRLAKQNFDMEDTSHFGMAAMPQAGGNATLSGGEVFMVPASVPAERAEAAVKWMIFYYAEPQYDPERAAAEAEKLAEDENAAVGVPVLPMFNQDQMDQINEAIAPYVNVELENFEPYLTDLAQLELKPEPPLNAQAVYQALDPVVQAVLTEENADVDTLLADAEAEANNQLASAQ